MNSAKSKVIVCGAGIGGLTVAHELAKRGFEVTIYERNDSVGGLARSKYYKDPASQYEYPVEYSWRVYGQYYKNLLRVLDEIPVGEQTTSSVNKKLVEVFTYVFPRFDKKEVIVERGKNARELTKDLAFSEKLKILDKVLYCMTMSTQRMDSMDHIKWKDYCADLSPEAQKYMVRMWGPVLGMDPSLMSFPVVARLIVVILGGVFEIASTLYLMPKPTNDAWFDEWVGLLQKKGVTIKTKHEIKNIKVTGGRISGVVVEDQANGQQAEHTADYYVCGLPAEAIAKIVEQSPSLSQFPVLKNTIEMAKHGRQIQLSVQMFLGQKINYPSTDKLILYLPDTPWALIIEPQDKIWDATYSTDPKVKTVLSVGICQVDAPGIRHAKPFTECTEREVKEEVWAQICKSYRMSSIRTEQGEPIEQATIELFYMWDSYRFDPDKKVIDSWEPKFSNNIKTLQYQPDPVTDVPNLFFAAGYAKTSRFIYSMESAAEAGTLAANEIIRLANSSNGTEHTPTEVFKSMTTLNILSPLVWLDKVLFKIKAPHLSRLFLGNSLFLVITYLIGLPLLLIAVLAALTVVILR
ncbi:MAG: FAD-dependent oxidoreductase [bacterium]|nr:FAD-dependent oxidoreductase [bacterium]